MEALSVIENKNIKWGRALLHFGLYVTLVAIYYFANLDERSALGVYAMAGIVIVGLDVLRFSSLSWKAFVNDTLASWNIIKDDELEKVSGLSIGVVGMAFVMCGMDKMTTIFAALCVASIDPAARIGGKLWGRDRIFGNKTLQGTLCGIVVGLITVMVGYAILGAKWGMPHVFAIVCAAFAELMVKEFDNFAIPLVAAGALKLATLSTLTYYGGV